MRIRPGEVPGRRGCGPQGKPKMASPALGRLYATVGGQDAPPDCQGRGLQVRPRQTEGGQPCNPAATVRIRDGDRLSTNAEEAVVQFAAHFAGLAGDDESARSAVTDANCEHWRAVLQEFWRPFSQPSRRRLFRIIPLAPDREIWAEALLEGRDHDFTLLLLL